MTGAAFLPLLAYAIASGYLICAIPLWLLFSREYSGHALYFRVLVAGLLWQAGFAFYEQPPIAGLISAFVLYGCVLVLMKAVFYLWHGAEIRFYKRSFDVSQKFFEAHLMKAMESDLQIMVTLESGKVYIGWAKSVRRRADIKWLTLLPVISGYRDDEQALQIMVDYSGTLLKKAFSQRHTAGDLNLDITLPVEKIATLQFFDADFYRSINPHPAG